MSDLLASLSSGAGPPSSLVGVAKPGKNKKGNGDPPLRQGKWTREEEEYVHCLIDEFKTGMMPLAEGTSLRTFLSKMLNCHPMRISKKFVGSNYNGKQVYARRTGSDRLSNEEVRERRAKLGELERKFLAKITAPGGGGGGNKNTAPSAPEPIMSLQQQQQQQALPPSIPSSLQLPTQFGGGGGNNGISRVSTSGVDLRNLLNQAAVNQTSSGGGGGASSADLTRNLSLLDMPLNTSGNSNHSLQNLFQELVNSNSLAGNSSNSLEAFSMMMQHQQQQQQHQQNSQHSNNFLHNSLNNNSSNNAHHKSNSRAAAAGRALLQSGLGLDLPKKQTSSQPISKPLESFTSAELAAELRKRSSLKDLLAGLSGAGGGGGGGGSSSSKNMSSSNPNPSASLSGGGGGLGQSLASLQGSLQQAADATSNANAFSSLIRNSSIDMSNLIERQGSIDSLSNLAIRSRLQSIQSMGSLLDPLLDGAGANFGSSNNNNSNWTAGLGNLAAKVSTENFGKRTANDLMESLGVSRSSLSNLGGGGGCSSSNSEALRSLGNSGLNLASLLNNEDALRRLEASAPSSLNQNFSFQNDSSHHTGGSGGRRSSLLGVDTTSKKDENTAIAQFLLQKKLLEGDKKPTVSSASTDQHQLMMNMAAAGSSSGLGGGGGGGGSSSSGGMDPLMSSLLSSLRSNNDNMSSSLSTSNNNPAPETDLDALKRKFFGSTEGLMLAANEEQHRRNKPFR